VVHRHALRATLSELCRLLTKAPPGASLDASSARPQLAAPASA